MVRNLPYRSVARCALIKLTKRSNLFACAIIGSLRLWRISFNEPLFCWKRQKKHVLKYFCSWALFCKDYFWWGLEQNKRLRKEKKFFLWYVNLWFPLIKATFLCQKRDLVNKFIAFLTEDCIKLLFQGKIRLPNSLF